ncbi:putative phosphoribosylaminoimidazole-succinocarboxamide synthase [Microdochium trichocladiopsis]|uniref:Phosphoribosylaminoimidazole-succinocarboxamide synthase n=1 Tax=Microdochium trichocladiopsis TaxID=1682393 RepID=A0A9P9BUH1_9PEZI|nr:putative phosphoribosylaminoimidazole-succinocarboxamide synthase [Microdochium trichocladiopsis]KAH7037469.1 putative phosphoribosylaminoimidazole-succinocarboxamide synthase [Microdochium trichocladiopsis]
MTSNAVTSIDLTSLRRLASGKVRDLYEVDDETLLFVTTDRISAYDVVMKNGIPDKGLLLTFLSVHWFKVLADKIPGLKTHFLSTTLPASSSSISPEDAATIKGRSMHVRKLKVFPVEAIVRGYVTGSAWKEYQAKGTVHGIKLPAGLRECDAIPGGPIYTPSTKAPLGQHDENIHPDEAAKLVGDKYAKTIEDLALRVFRAGQEYAAERGIIIADTKFEFALDDKTDEVVLVDEVLTSDSSRMWPKDKYEPGRDQESFDKQFLRNWLTKEGLKGKPDVTVPEDIAKATSDKYREVFERLTGQTLEQAMQSL